MGARKKDARKKGVRNAGSRSGGSSPPREKRRALSARMGCSYVVALFVGCCLMNMVLFLLSNDASRSLNSSSLSLAFSLGSFAGTAPLETPSSATEMEANKTVEMENRTRHAIVVPYKGRDDRQMQHYLQVFRQHMSDYLKHFLPRSDFDIWIVEQDDRNTLNKGWLYNVGFSEAMKHSPDIECIVLHDVDLIPDVKIGKAVPYDKCVWPTRLANEIESFEWNIPQADFTGGVVGISASHYRQINGFSNSVGGYPDEDLRSRLLRHSLLKRERLWDKTIQRGLIMAAPRMHGSFRFVNESVPHPAFTKRPERSRPSMTWQTDGVSRMEYHLNDDSSSDRTVHLERPEDLPGFASYHHIQVGR